MNALGNKAYWAQFDDAPDYVVMFIPGEHFCQQHWSRMGSCGTMRSSGGYCWRRQPLIVISHGRGGVAAGKLAKEARQIGELGKELYDRLPGLPPTCAR